MASPVIDVLRRMEFELNRDKIEEEFAYKEADAENLTSWGAALLELSQMGYSIEASEKMNRDAIKKLSMAVEMDPANDEAQWWLGSAHSALAFHTPDLDKANIDFDKALECFQKADQLCPGQNHYIKSLRRCTSGHNREWHAMMHGPNPVTYVGGPAAKHEPEANGGSAASLSAKEPQTIHTNGGLYHVFQQIRGGVSAASSSAKGIARNKKSDSKYDMYGWATLAAGLVAMANSNGPRHGR